MHGRASPFLAAACVESREPESARESCWLIDPYTYRDKIIHKDL